MLSEREGRALADIELRLQHQDPRFVARMRYPRTPPRRLRALIPVYGIGWWLVTRLLALRSKPIGAVAVALTAVMVVTWLMCRGAG